MADFMTDAYGKTLRYNAYAKAWLPADETQVQRVTRLGRKKPHIWLESQPTGLQLNVSRHGVPRILCMRIERIDSRWHLRESALHWTKVIRNNTGVSQ